MRVLQRLFFGWLRRAGGHTVAAAGSGAVSTTTGGRRKLAAQATGMAMTAMIRPVITVDEAVKAPIATPPAYEPKAMPTFAAEAGSEDASCPPGPARLTTRYCIE